MERGMCKFEYIVSEHASEVTPSLDIDMYQDISILRLHMISNVAIADFRLEKRKHWLLIRDEVCSN